MLDLNTTIIVAVFSGMVTTIIMLLIIAYFLVWKAVKEAKFANLGGVEKCNNSWKFIQEKIIWAKPIGAESSCILQDCDMCSIYTDSETLPP